MNSRHSLDSRSSLRSATTSNTTTTTGFVALNPISFHLACGFDLYNWIKRNISTQPQSILPLDPPPSVNFQPAPTPNMIQPNAPPSASRSSSTSTSIPNPVHIVLICHGVGGRPSQMGTLKSYLEKTSNATDPVPLKVHVCESYKIAKSYDGIDLCAGRVIKEMETIISGLKKEDKTVTKFSILG